MIYATYINYYGKRLYELGNDYTGQLAKNFLGKHERWVWGEEEDKKKGYIYKWIEKNRTHRKDRKDKRLN